MRKGIDAAMPLEHIANRILLARAHKVLLDAWRSHFVISNPAAKMALRRAPYAFTEHGALMAATVLNSARAVEISLYVVRAFVRLRELLTSHKDLARRLEAHERKLARHDEAIAGLMNTIRSLLASPTPASRRPIGFVRPEKNG